MAVEPPQAVTLTFARSDGLGATRTVGGPGDAADHALPVYFLAPHQEAATAWPDPVASTTFATGDPPEAVRSSLTATGASTMGLVGTHLPCTDDAVAVIYDTDTGDLVWYQEVVPGGQFGPVDMVVFTEDHTVLGESLGDVVEVDLLGAELAHLEDLDVAFGLPSPTPGPLANLHHDLTKHGGVYYAFYQEPYGPTPDILDTVVVFDATGAELARWYPIDHLVLPPTWSGDFLHTNAITVDRDGDLLLSWYRQDTVAKIAGDWTSPSFGVPRWILAGSASGEVGNTLTTDWSAVDGADEFARQHSLTAREDGRLQLLDNTGGRALVLDLDEAAGTAAVVGAYPTREGRCGPQGTSRSTAAGNPVVGCAGEWVREYDFATGDLLWEAEVRCEAGPGPGAARWYPLDGW